MSLSRLAATLVFLLTALTVTTASATTLQLLRNGGFEQGKSGWTCWPLIRQLPFS